MSEINSNGEFWNNSKKPPKKKKKIIPEMGLLKNGMGVFLGNESDIEKNMRWTIERIDNGSSIHIKTPSLLGNIYKVVKREEILIEIKKKYGIKTRRED